MGFGSSFKKAMGRVDPLGSAVLGGTVLKNSSWGNGGKSIWSQFGANLKAPIQDGQKTIKLENKLSTGTVRESSHALGGLADAVGVNSSLPNLVEQKAEKDSQSSTRKWTNAAAATAAGYGGYSALSGYAGGGLSGLGSSLGTAGKYAGAANSLYGAYNNLTGGGNMGGGDLLGVVGGLSDAKRQGDAANQYKAWMDQRQALNDNMYAPGSAEYNALWDEMSRKDAAAGRNSQYGPRSVDLAARIAQIKARENTAMTTGLSRGYSQALNQNAAKYSGLLSALGAGGGGTGGISSLLSSLYGSGGGGGSLADYDYSYLTDGMFGGDGGSLGAGGGFDLGNMTDFDWGSVASYG